MTQLFKLIHNVETNEIVEIPLTVEEIAQLEKENLDAENRFTEKENIELQKISLFEKLGITEEEAKLLLS